MHLTQVALQVVWSPNGRLPADSSRVRGPVLDRRRLSRVPLSIAVAGGVSVSTLRMWQGVGGSRHLVPVFELRLSDLSDGWHRVPDRKSTRLNSSHRCISYAVFCL